MADNDTTYQPATAVGNVPIASDDIGGIRYQRVKVTYGADGSSTDVSPTNPLPVAAQGAAFTSTSTNIAVSTPANTSAVDVSKAGNVTFTVKNQTAASAYTGAPVLVFEQSDDGTSWGPLPVVRNDTLQVAATFTLAANTANGELMFDAAMEGVGFVRVRVTTAQTGNGMTIVIQPGGLAFTPYGVSVPYGPSSVTGGGPASVTAAITDTLILAANPLRRGFAICNDSTATLSLSYGTNAASVTARTVVLATNAFFEDPFNYRGQVRGIWSAANGAARVTEML